jgi:hypothetical protein
MIPPVRTQLLLGRHQEVVASEALLLLISLGALQMLLCDSCEREYHVGCLRAAGACDLAALPEGEFFCSEACKAVHDAVLGALVPPSSMFLVVSRILAGLHRVTSGLSVQAAWLQRSLWPLRQCCLR